MGGDHWLLIYSARALLGPEIHWFRNSCCISAGRGVQAQPAADMTGLPAFAHPVFHDAAAICALRRSTESLHSIYRRNQDPTTSGALVQRLLDDSHTQDSSRRCQSSTAKLNNAWNPAFYSPWHVL